MIFQRHPSRSPRNWSGAHALTLVELLVAVAILAVLAAGGGAVYQSALRKGDQVKEINAGRTLITAYLNYANDHNGELMVASYVSDAGTPPDLRNLNIRWPDGTRIPADTGEEPLHRYAHRLAPYFEYQIEDVLLISPTAREYVRRVFAGNYHYGVSLATAFGINHRFVGGFKAGDVLAGGVYSSDGDLVGSGECVTRLSQAPNPAHLLVFATAFHVYNGERIPGFPNLEPPYWNSKLWDKNLNVDPRHDGKAVCVFLDGSIQFKTVDELRDMRYWSREAQLRDNASYRVPVKGVDTGALPGRP